MTYEEIANRLISGWKYTAIQEDLGVSSKTVARVASQLRSEGRLPQKVRNMNEGKVAEITFPSERKVRKVIEPVRSEPDEEAQRLDAIEPEVKRLVEVSQSQFVRSEPDEEAIEFAFDEKSGLPVGYRPTPLTEADFDHADKKCWFWVTPAEFRKLPRWLRDRMSP